MLAEKGNCVTCMSHTYPEEATLRVALKVNAQDLQQHERLASMHRLQSTCRLQMVGLQTSCLPLHAQAAALLEQFYQNKLQPPHTGCCRCRLATHCIYSGI